MRFFLDTEFFEDGSDEPIKLISLAMTSEYGDEIYVVNNDFNWSEASPWLVENVLPHIEDGHPLRVSFADIGPLVLGWISRTAGASKPEFWGYYADYDWVVFCQLFGRMVDLPSNFPKYCMDLKQFSKMLGDPNLPKQEAKLHSALNDARWMRVTWDFLAGVALKQSADELNKETS